MEFPGEEGQDGGGLTREFWCYLARDIKQSMCEGDEVSIVFRHDSVALQVHACIQCGVFNLNNIHR